MARRDPPPRGALKSQPLSSKAARALLRTHADDGFPVDRRLLQEIVAPGRLSRITMETAEEFLSLVWQQSIVTQPLAPPMGPRSLGDCVARLAAYHWDFSTLVAAGWSWFETCVAIDAEFDVEKLGLLAITPLVFAEKATTPQGSYYVYDGVHRSIVLAKKLIREEIGFSPVRAILLEPRRH